MKSEYVNFKDGKLFLLVASCEYQQEIKQCKLINYEKA